ncbi:MAG TPA: hypothetical protein VN448_04455 [Gammaproteobacteria bacterium]|nr:hypothetical protein [Gammaproteobacteria bacterium]
MNTITHDALRQFLNDHIEHAPIRALHEAFIGYESASTEYGDVGGLISLYQKVIPLIEKTLQTADFDAGGISIYHQAFRELEALIASTGIDDRHSFVVVIPVADRPRHLQDCLNSLLELCHTFGYGGQANGRYRKVMVIIADDSKAPDNIEHHHQITRHFDNLGLETLYFGIDEQLAQLDRLPDTVRRGLVNIVGDIDRSKFYHKGPSILRNIVYLKLNDLRKPDNRQLFYFIDSDQEFKVKLCGKTADRDAYLINYFYQLDRVFSETQTRVMTGKVVGDPPVSPAVMAGTFLDDVRGFLEQIDHTAPNAPCPFHGQERPNDSGAAYHDMAGLFGFDANQLLYNYRCTLVGEHDIADCLVDFARKLNRFFDGEHPTRLTYFDATESVANTRPARTVYTGNYILRADALRYFVPFATLKLRMAGPVLGRIIQSEIGNSFVSANLPLLHKRTVRETGQAEFRPGIEKSAQVIDLSGEFERQFFGDVMLFTVEKLSGLGYPNIPVPEHQITQLLTETEDSMYRLYTEKHMQILSKIRILERTLSLQGTWAHILKTHAVGECFTTFLHSMTHNFGENAHGYQQIASTEHRATRHRQILGAIKHYTHDRAAWEAALDMT